MKAVDPLSQEGAHAIVEGSLGHLFRLIRPKGRFVYVHEAGDIERAGEGYNMLRHCGTLWFMLRAVNEMGIALGPGQGAALARAVGYAGQKMERPAWIAAEGPCFGLVTKGAVKLGGIGLALVMLQEFKTLMRRDGLEAEGLPASLDDTIAGLEAYALAQIEGGDFLHKRRFDTGEVLPFRSDYYTGEALLGLMRSDRDFPEADAVCERLMGQGYGIDVQSHWMAYAACEAVERGRVPREAGLDYLRRLMEAIAGDHAYRARRESTPIACRTEALTRYLLLARGIGPRDPEVVAMVREAAEGNLRLQLDWHRDGQFWKGDSSRKVQIDFIQHNATAFLNWWGWGQAAG